MDERFRDPLFLRRILSQGCAQGFAALACRRSRPGPPAVAARGGTCWRNPARRCRLPATSSSSRRCCPRAAMPTVGHRRPPTQRYQRSRSARSAELAAVDRTATRAGDWPRRSRRAARTRRRSRACASCTRSGSTAARRPRSAARTARNSPWRRRSCSWRWSNCARRAARDDPPRARSRARRGGNGGILPAHGDSRAAARDHRRADGGLLCALRGDSARTRPCCGDTQRAAPDAGLAPLVICYALVNRPYMLDLQPDRSLIRGLLARGLDVYLVDWGYPDRGDSAPLARRLREPLPRRLHRPRAPRARRRLRSTCSASARAGRCRSATRRCIPERVRNLVTMVTPVDFHTEDNLLSRNGCARSTSTAWSRCSATCPANC